MAYENGTATSQEDLMTKLRTFATSNGWTSDDWDTTNDEFAMHRNSIYPSFRWDNTASTGGISIHQALGFTGGQTPGNHPNDSGNGQKAGTPINTERRLDRIGDGTFPNYYFFSGSVYLHVVLEYATGLYRHMVFGELEKVGTWTGGEFTMGHIWSTAAGQKDNPTYAAHYLPFDAVHNNLANETGTVHLEGFPDQPASGRWGLVTAMQSGLGNDGDSNGRAPIVGGVRDGPLTTAFQFIAANPSNGYIPLIPIPLFYAYYTPTPDEWRLLGFVPGMRVINIRNLSEGDEFTLGSDVWKVFPWVRKRYQLDNEDESWNGGFAFLK